VPSPAALRFLKIIADERGVMLDLIQVPEPGLVLTAERFGILCQGGESGVAGGLWVVWRLTAKPLGVAATLWSLSSSPPRSSGDVRPADGEG